MCISGDSIAADAIGEIDSLCAEMDDYATHLRHSLRALEWENRLRPTESDPHEEALRAALEFINDMSARLSHHVATVVAFA